MTEKSQDCPQHDTRCTQLECAWETGQATSAHGYELRASEFAKALTALPETRGNVTCHGRFSTDWIDSNVPRGGAEEIAALRVALDDLHQRYLKEKPQHGPDSDDFAINVHFPEYDGRGQLLLDARCKEVLIASLTGFAVNPAEMQSVRLDLALGIEMILSNLLTKPEQKSAVHR